MNKQFEAILPIRKMKVEHFQKWAKTNLTTNDAVVIEATTNTWMFYDGY